MGQERGLGCCLLDTKVLYIGTSSSGVGLHRQVTVESHSLHFQMLGGRRGRQVIKKYLGDIYDSKTKFRSIILNN